MSMGRTLRRAVIAVGAVVSAAYLQAAPASAQLFWDWGGGNQVGGSGREVVRFSPRYAKGEIVVSFGDRRLYYISKPGEAISYPIAVPREQSRWAGLTSVTSKRINPSWTPTPDMMAENPRLPRWVPGGHPMNPLGVRALYLGSSTYRIHGTDAPWTIGTAVSKGCIRMYNEDVLDLYPRANVGAKVTVTWDKFTSVASNTSSLFSFGNDDPAPEPKPKRSMVRKISGTQNQ
jgi:lipoprotein-anchoring transpeptidase ErfK/SrfK